MNRLVTFLVLLAAAASASAQSFPAKPIRVIIPFVAGGSSDIVGRAIAAKFQETLGQPGVVENRPGANGAIAAEFVAKAEPDGYTVLVGSIGVFSINAALFKDLRYNPVRDFAPLTLAVTTPNVLITKPTLAAGSLKELVDHMKKNPGKLSYCSSGTGSSDHLTAELLKQASGTDAVHVPYKGGAACQTDIMGNQVDFSFQNLGAVTNYIKGKRMKALAVTAKARHAQLPDVPSAGEAGVARPGRHLLAGRRRAGEDAEGDRGAAAWRDGEGAALARYRRAHEPDRLRRGGELAGGVRRLHEGRGRALDAGGRQRKHQA